MLKGVNDTPAEAKALVRLLKGLPAKINLIPFNPWPGSAFECSDWETIERFSEIVFNAGYASPVRTPRGPRHPRRLRPAQEREREIAGAGADDARGEFGRWTGLTRAQFRATGRTLRERGGARRRLAAAPLDLSGALRASVGDIFRLPRLDRRGIVGADRTRPPRLAVDLALSRSAGRKGRRAALRQWVATTEPGLHVHLPYPIETVLLPKVTQINQIQLGVGLDGRSQRRPERPRPADADRR